MTDSMIERVARAICLKSCEGIEDVDWEYEDQDVQEHYLDLARAAVEALRETTEAMCEASYSRERKMGFVGNLAPRGMNHSAIWETIIDAILAEGQPASPAPATEGASHA